KPMLAPDDSATAAPNWAEPLAPAAVSFEPSWVQVAPERLNTHAAPASPSSSGPPISAVFPSEDSATLVPTPATIPVIPLPVSFDPCWLQFSPERVNTHPAPFPASSSGPPISAVFPFEDSATL